MLHRSGTPGESARRQTIIARRPPPAARTAARAVETYIARAGECCTGPASVACVTSRPAARRALPAHSRPWTRFCPARQPQRSTFWKNKNREKIQPKSHDGASSAGLWLHPRVHRRAGVCVCCARRAAGIAPDARCAALQPPQSCRGRRAPARPPAPTPRSPTGVAPRSAAAARAAAPHARGHALARVQRARVQAWRAAAAPRARCRARSTGWSDSRCAPAVCSGAQ